MKIHCLALASLSLVIATQAHGASFDCTRARAPDEKRICAVPGLNDLDVRMVALLDLDESTVAMGARGSLQDDQSAWLKTRQACGANTPCIHARYEARIKALTDHLVNRLCGKDGPPC